MPINNLSRFAFAAVLFLAACQKQDLQIPETPATQFASKNAKAPNGVALDWMEAYRVVVKSESKSPPQASRIYAYAAIALYEAVVPGTSNYKSLEGQITGLKDLPKPANLGKIDFTLAANEALYQVSTKIFENLKPGNSAVFKQLYDDYLDYTSVSTETMVNSKRFGESVAAAVLERASKDGYAITRSLTYTVPASSINLSYWQPTGPVSSPLEPYWGLLKCFAMADGTACTIKSSIPFSVQPGSAFYKQADEVATTGNNLTQEQKDIALWWADNSGATPTPPGHWVAIGGQIAKQLNLDLGKTAEMYAKMNIAMADAFISCWNEKYNLNLLRPVTYIRKFIPSNSTWSSFIGTPPFPEYPSGHSVASAAAADILTRLFGKFSFTDNSNTSMGLAKRTYGSFDEAAKEAAISRLYGGIHFREAIENGLRQGKEVAKALNTKIVFRK